jgi:hypothetical protein
MFDFLRFNSKPTHNALLQNVIFPHDIVDQLPTILIHNEDFPLRGVSRGISRHWIEHESTSPLAAFRMASRITSRVNYSYRSYPRVALRVRWISMIEEPISGNSASVRPVRKDERSERLCAADLTGANAIMYSSQDFEIRGSGEAGLFDVAGLEAPSRRHMLWRLKKTVPMPQLEVAFRISIYTSTMSTILTRWCI